MWWRRLSRKKMEVAAANATSMDLDENLVGRDLRMRAVENLETPITEARESHPGFHPFASRV